MGNERITRRTSLFAGLSALLATVLLRTARSQTTAKTVRTRPQPERYADAWGNIYQKRPDGKYERLNEVVFGWDGTWYRDYNEHWYQTKPKNFDGVSYNERTLETTWETL
jgi:hypothetical protein